MLFVACAVNFEDTHVPVENVLGELNKGFKIAMQILNGGRYELSCYLLSCFLF